MELGKHRSQLVMSITVYLGVLLGIGMLFFIGLGLVVDDKGKELNRDILQLKRDATRTELATAIKLAVDELERTRHTLSGWDEVQQQLSNSRYYDYWKANRLLGSGILPKSVQWCELYNRSGKRLGSANPGKLPTRYLDALTGAQVTKADGEAILQYGYPLKQDDSTEVHGYILMRANLRAALQHSGALHSINPAQLTDNLADGSVLPVSELIDHLLLPETQTPAAVRLSNLIAETLRDFLIIAALLSIFIWLVVIYLYVRPLRQLSLYIDSLRQGDPRKTVPVTGYGLVNVAEIVKTYQSLNAFHEQLEQRNAELVQLANYDPLTGLPNRTLMRERLIHAIQHARRSHARIGLIFLDLDRFKNVNDTLGHQFGDALLKQVAQRLVRAVRDSDTVARLGGDEFTIIIENVVDPDKLSEIATHIVEHLAIPLEIEDRLVTISASLGITLFPDDGDDPDRLIKNADTAMYRAKELGRNNFQYFTEEMNTKAMERLELEHALRNALAQDEFILYFQPRMDMRNEAVVGVEALLRWQRRDMAMVLPERFIAILEDTGLIIPVGEWVLRQACQQLQQWLASGVAPIQMAVNISARQFQDKQLVDRVQQILHATGVPARLVELEITESLLLENQESALDVLDKLHGIGVSISLDDFGTGYSSLSYLLRFPIDTIKIDRSFIAGVPYDADACAITRAIIALSKSLKLKVTAEGIETREQAEFIRALACDEGQGFLYSRPLPAENIGALLKRAQ